MSKLQPKPNRGGNRRNNDLAARVLAEAAVYGGKLQVAKKHGIPERTFFEWQNSLLEDAELAALYQQALTTITRQHWGEDLSLSIRRSVEKVTTMIEQLEPTAENLKVAVEAVQQLMKWEQSRVVAEVELARVRQELVGGSAGRDGYGAEDLPERPNAQA